MGFPSNGVNVFKLTPHLTGLAERDLENNLFIKMHNAGLVHEKSAKSLEELADYLSLDRDYLKRLIEIGRKHGYLDVVENGVVRYFLSKKGIMFVSSLFTRGLRANSSVPSSWLAAGGVFFQVGTGLELNLSCERVQPGNWLGRYR